MGHPCKTTKQEFRRFRSECLRLQKLLGLSEWALSFSHEDLSENTAAQIDIDIEGMIATITFAKCWHGSTSPESCALHEMLHLLIGRLWLLGKERYSRQDELDAENEVVVRRLEKFVFMEE